MHVKPNQRVRAVCRFLSARPVAGIYFHPYLEDVEIIYAGSHNNAVFTVHIGYAASTV